jgi:phage tail-like protein
MPDRSVLFPAYTFVIALSDSLGAQQPLGGFTQVTGLPIKVKGMNKQTDVTLKRGVVNSSALSAWIQSARSGAGASRRNVVLTQRDNTGAPVVSWRFNNAYPKVRRPCAGSQG